MQKFKGLCHKLLISYIYSLFYQELLQDDVYETSSPHSDCGAWEILWNFATSSMTLPAAKEQLKTHLGDQYNAQDWQPVLDAVMNAEGNIIQAQEALAQLSSMTQLLQLTIRLPPWLDQVWSDPISISCWIVEAENNLMDLVEEPVKCKWIIGPPPSRTLSTQLKNMTLVTRHTDLREVMQKLWLRSVRKQAQSPIR